MKLILLSGGSGKRLWPLSNDSRSKQFLKVLKNENEQMESMVQRVWQQLIRAGLDKSTYITTSKAHLDIIHRQLGDDIPVIVEPLRKDTYPAIVLASSYLYSMIETNLDEVICVLPVDPYVDDYFFERLKELEGIIKSSNSDIALMGINPTYPSEKYGYIVPRNNTNKNQEYFEVSHFIEKPKEDVAMKLIEKNALWNSGVFAFKLSYLINKMCQEKLHIDYQDLIKNYDTLPQNSFDYEVVEKTKNIVSISYDGYWKDLGTWNTLTDTMSTNLIGDAIVSEDSINTHVINELEVPLVVIGVSNVVIATSPEGILVTEKSKSHQIKDYVKNVNTSLMYEEFQWGSYKILDYIWIDEEQEILTRRLQILPLKKICYQMHKNRNLTWNIVNGEGVMIINEKKQFINSGDIIKISAWTKYAISSYSQLEIIEIQTGNKLKKDDKEIFSVDWENFK